MISVFVKEQKRYNYSELANLFQCNYQEMNSFIKKLKRFGILKNFKSRDKQLEIAVLQSDEFDLVEEYSESDNYYFSFVGIVVVFGRVLKCYPKYISSNLEPTSHFMTVLKVLERYKAKEQVINSFENLDGNGFFNLLGIIIDLIEDYYEYGIYINEKDIIEINGSGEIIWDYTVNESPVLISENRLFYTELYTQNRINSGNDYFTRLHEFILTICSRELKRAGLLDLFEIIPVLISEEQIEDFGEKDQILYMIQKELSIQYNTRKQRVLSLMYTYILNHKKLSDNNHFSFFGTVSFNIVWEKVCSDIMVNQLYKPLSSLSVPLKIDSNFKLIEIIEKPKIYATDNGVVHEANDTLIPDIISFYINEELKQFIIFDAKYYTPSQNSEKISGYPGISDITKQYLYQLAYKKFIEDSGFTTVKNCFLMPTESNKVSNKGKIKIDFLSQLGLEDIDIRQLPAEEVYNLYLRNEKFNIENLKL